MNAAIKAKITVRRLLAQMGEAWLKQDRLSVRLDIGRARTDHVAMKKLIDELRSEAARLETAPPDPRNRELRAHRERMDDLIGRKVRLLRTIRTRGGDEFPAGSIMEISGHYRGRVHLKDNLWHPWDGSKPIPIESERVEGYENAAVPTKSEQALPGGQQGYVRGVELDKLELIPKEGP